MNKAIIQGNLTRGVELKSLPNGTKVANFSVATSKVWYNDQKQKQEKTTFHNMVAFGKQGENIARFFNKGSKILVEGELQTQSWDDATSGKKMYRTEINVQKFHFCESAGNANVTSSEPAQTAAPQEDVIEYPEEDINPDDIPF